MYAAKRRHSLNDARMDATESRY